jgi:hypothetical protein
MNILALLDDLWGIMDTTHPQSLVQLIQEVLNAMIDAGFITGNKLTVDGVFGLDTFAAIKLVQAKLGFAVQEPIASAEYELLLTWLPKL